ncbi:RHS repeat-associated core domain-containing protein, partial [Pseudomonas sp. ENNP23]|uniref:RHS repeat-associated core domain-containing protein n=1 Tax=Pseudomonas sp. ENNP23 TaxID=1535636 RepID=UPI000B246EE4
THAHSLFGSLDYQYDALDRLTEEKAADSRKAYAYDATGNRTSRTTYATTNGSEAQTAKQSLRYAPDSNRLAQRSTSYAVEADAAGHYTRYSQSRRYTYDDQGRLSAVTDKVGTPIAHYAYNALGQRVLKEVQQGTARTPYTYLYGPDGQVMGQVRYTTAGRKSQASYYVWLDSLPIAQINLTYSAGTTIASTTLTYLHSDHLNTPRLATNQGGNLVWSWPSDAFGVGQPNTYGSTIDVVLRFPGQIADAHSGLYYNYFRDYDPETGRYVESDPIGLNGGLNTFGYVASNPIKYSDPSGLLLAAPAAGVAVQRCVANPACQALVGGGIAISAICLLHPELCENAVNAACDDVSSSLGGIFSDSTLSPGAHAGDSIPARGPDRDFTPDERDRINEIGADTGCHTCGATEPGTKSGNFVPDHQPPSSLNPEGNPQELYPHCLHCSRVQGGQANAAKNGGNR